MRERDGPVVGAFPDRSERVTLGDRPTPVGSRRAFASRLVREDAILRGREHSRTPESRPAGARGQPPGRDCPSRRAASRRTAAPRASSRAETAGGRSRTARSTIPCPPPSRDPASPASRRKHDCCLRVYGRHVQERAPIRQEPGSDLCAVRSLRRGRVRQRIRRLAAAVGDLPEPVILPSPASRRR